MSITATILAANNNIKNNKKELIDSIAKIINSKPDMVVKLLKEHKIAVPDHSTNQDIALIVSSTLSQSKSFATHMANLILDGNFSANGNEIVNHIGETFGGLKKPNSFNADSAGILAAKKSSGVVLHDSGAIDTFGAKLQANEVATNLNNQIALDSASANLVNAVNDNSSNPSSSTGLFGMSTTMTITIGAVLVVGIIFGVLKFKKKI